MSQGLFLVGTDTGVGKTRVAATIAAALHVQGKRVGVYKPVASGCAPDPCGRLQSDDALELWHAAGRPLTPAHVCPQCFLAPLAPDLAAHEEGRMVDDELLLSGLTVWREGFDITIVESAGGLLSPLSETRTSLDLAIAVGWPVILVVPNRLGAINQAGVSVAAMRSLAPDLPLAGIVLNHPLPRDERRDPSQTTNRREIVRRCGVPILAELAFDATVFDVPLDWETLSRMTI